MLGRVALVVALLVAGLGIWLAVRPPSTPAVITEESPAPTPPPASAPVPATSSPNLRGRLVFEGAAPSGLRVEIVPEGRMGSLDSSPIEVGLDAELTFEIPRVPARFVGIRATWPEGAALLGPVDPNQVEGESPPSVEVWRLGTGSLTGRVLDSSGSPVVGARVLDVLGHAYRPAVLADRTTKTDSTGSWRFEFLPAGRHEITLWHPRSPILTLQRTDEAIELKAGEQRTISLGWEAGDVTWSGRLRWSGQAQVPKRVRIELSDRGSSRVHLLESAPDGSFQARLRPGTYGVVVISRKSLRHTLRAPVAIRCTDPSSSMDCVRIDGDVRADLTLVGGNVAGRLVASRVEGGSPPTVVFDARTPENPMGGLAWISPDDEGRFSATALPPGRYQVRAGLGLSNPDLVGPDGQPVVVDVVDGGEITGLELRVKAP